MTDPIADMFTRIRNAYAVRRELVAIPHSKVKEAILKTLTAEGYVKSYAVEATVPQKTLTVTLKYVGTSPAITHLERISKPGRRVYLRQRDLTAPLSGYGLTIVTTSQGIMTNKQALTKKVGGEVICQVW